MGEGGGGGGKEFKRVVEEVRRLGEKFPQIKKCFFVSCKKMQVIFIYFSFFYFLELFLFFFLLNTTHHQQQGIEPLAQFLVRTALLQPYMGETVPKQVFDLESSLEKYASSLLDSKCNYQSAPIISWETFCRFCDMVLSFVFPLSFSFSFLISFLSFLGQNPKEKQRQTSCLQVCPPLLFPPPPSFPLTPSPFPL